MDEHELISYSWYISLLHFCMPHLLSPGPEARQHGNSYMRLYTWQMAAISCGSILWGLLSLEKKKSWNSSISNCFCIHFFGPKDIWLILQLALAVVITECLLHKLWHIQNVKILISAAATQVENWKSLNRKLANICSVTSQACGVLCLPWTKLPWPSSQGMQLFYNIPEERHPMATNESII